MHFGPEDEDPFYPYMDFSLENIGHAFSNQPFQGEDGYKNHKFQILTERRVKTSLIAISTSPKFGAYRIIKNICWRVRGGGNNRQQSSKWGILPHGVFAPCTWHSRGLTRREGFLGCRRRRLRNRRRRHLEVELTNDSNNQF